MSETSPRRVWREGARQRARALPRHTAKHLRPTTDETSEGERRAMSVRPLASSVRPLASIARPLASNKARATTVRNRKRLHNKRSESASARHQQTVTRAASRIVGVTVRFSTIAHFAPVVADRGDKPHPPPNRRSATPTAAHQNERRAAPPLSNQRRQAARAHERARAHANMNDRQSKRTVAK